MGIESEYKRVAHVVMGEPPADYKIAMQDMWLKEKKMGAEAEAKRVRRIEAAEAARKKAEEAKKKQIEELRKKRMEAAKTAKEAKDATNDEKGEEDSKNDGQEDADMEAKEEDKEQEEVEEEIKVELTDEEKQMSFRKRDISDLTPKELSISYSKFTIPKQDEGFDAINFVWHSPEECEKYLNQWMAEKKLYQRVEELQPSEWFKGKWPEWSRVLSSWKKRQQEFKDPSRKARAALAKKEEEAKK